MPLTFLWPLAGRYKLRPNLQFTLPDTTYTDSTKPTDPSIMNKLLKVENNRLQLSLLVEWRFNNLNASFEKIVGVRQCTVMVYSDVVESSVVGSGKFPLLREVQLSRTGDG